LAEWQIGVDVGGTFTDIVAFSAADAALRVGKVPSTPANQATGVLDAVRAVGVPLPDVLAFVHGTTVGTNAVLERKGVRCGLLTTAGFRDVLELGRRTRPHTYGLTGTFEAIIPRELRLEVTERLDASGRVLEPLDEEGVCAQVAELQRRGAEALVIHFIHAYANPAHELRAAAIARELWHNPFVTVGHEILPDVGGGENPRKYGDGSVAFTYRLLARAGGKKG